MLQIGISDILSTLNDAKQYLYYNVKAWNIYNDILDDGPEAQKDNLTPALVMH